MPWQIYPKNRPQENNSYLIRLKPDISLKFGLGGLPPIIIARYQVVDRQWLPNGTGIVPFSLSDDDVAEWHDIPN